MGRPGSVRTWLLARIPPALMEYPFEAFAAVYGTLAGLLVVATGEGVPESVSDVLPALVIRLWGVTVLVAGLTLALGMRRLWRLALPVGLRLLGGTLGIFVAVSLGTADDWTIIPGAALLAFLAILALARSLFLRAATEIRHRKRVEGVAGQ